jgi:hypothetical protein
MQTKYGIFDSNSVLGHQPVFGVIFTVSTYIEKNLTQYF